MTTMSDFPQAEVFIETGFGGGATLNYAVHHPFDEIHSIEIDPDLFELGVKRFAAHPQVTLHCGDSRDILPHIITPAKTTMFWLDAHWSGGNYRESTPGDECPLLGELAAITAVKWKTQPLIIMDDAVFFNRVWWETHADGDPYHMKAWPTTEDIESALPKYQITDWAGVLVAVPPGYSGQVMVAGRQFP